MEDYSKAGSWELPTYRADPFLLLGSSQNRSQWPIFKNTIGINWRDSSELRALVALVQGPG